MVTGIEILVGAIAGMCATFFMDLNARLLLNHQLIHIDGVRVVPTLLGRWTTTFIRTGRLFHKDIRAVQPLANEDFVGRCIHYLIGALLGISFVWVLPELPSVALILVWGVVFGLLTNVLPWLIMFPSFGFGFFGCRTQQYHEMIKLSMMNHAAFGLAMALLLIIFHQVL